jgi:dihydrofolate reductase
MISLIAALARNRVIGIHNRLPWRLPADLKFFRRTTLGHAVIMGRKNYESIGRPLPQRRNIVLSTDPGYQAPGCEVRHSLAAALAAAGDDPEIFIIGGANLYAQAMPLAERMYLTLIEAEFDGDAWFPEYDEKEWREIAREEHAPDADNPYRFSFLTLQRTRRPARTDRRD